MNHNQSSAPMGATPAEGIVHRGQQNLHFRLAPLANDEALGQVAADIVAQLEQLAVV